MSEVLKIHIMLGLVVSALENCVSCALWVFYELEGIFYAAEPF